MNRQTDNRGKTWGQRVLVLLAVFGVGVVLWLGIAWFGHVEGEEFAPDRFSRRRFYYWELPLVGIQVWPIQRKDQTGDLELHLISTKLVPLRPLTPKTRWDPVRISRGNGISSEGDANLLIGCFRYKHQMEYWLNWTKDHPKLAKVLWPEVARLARQRLYLFVPEVLDLAESATLPAALQTKIDATLADRYAEFARVQSELGNDRIAARFLSQALTYRPGDSRLLEARAKVYEALGQLDKAAADRSTVAEPQAEADPAPDL